MIHLQAMVFGLVGMGGRLNTPLQIGWLSLFLNYDSCFFSSDIWLYLVHANHLHYLGRFVFYLLHINKITMDTEIEIPYEIPFNPDEQYGWE